MTKESRASVSVFGGIAVTVGAALWLGNDYFPWWGYFIMFPLAMGALYNGMTESQAYEKMAGRED